MRVVLYTYLNGRESTAKKQIIFKKKTYMYEIMEFLFLLLPYNVNLQAHERQTIEYQQ